MTMKVMGLQEFGGPEVLKLLELERPTPADHQILIRVLGFSVNFADLQMRKGAFHKAGADFPVVPGLDAMGIVEACGSQVMGIQVGQRVIAFPHTGSYAEYVVADENLAFPIPDELSFEQAAACPIVSFTSHMLLAQVARLQAGETLLIHAAAGGIGTTAIQIAKSLGAGQIIGTVGSAEKVREAKEAGADFVIINDAEDFVERVNELTSGKGTDVILDSLGGNYTSRGMNCLALYGRLVAFGSASGSYSDVGTNLLHASCRSILGFSIATSRRLRPALFAPTAAAVIPLIASGAVEIKVSQVLPMEEAAKAHQLLEDRAVTGKVVLRV